MVKIIITKATERDNNVGIFEGDVFEADPYRFDPDKWTLIRKISGNKKKYKDRTYNYYRCDAALAKEVL